MKTLISILLLFCSFVSYSQVLEYPPRDESNLNPEFSKFISDLKQIVKDKNSSKLLEMLDDSIKFDFDEGFGKMKFIKKWKPENKKSELWVILSKVVRLGGVFHSNKDTNSHDFVFPYVNQIELKEGDEYFETLVVTQKNAELKQKPSKQSKTITKLSYNVLTYDYKKSNKSWYFVKTNDNSFSGFIESKFVWSPIGYRLWISNESGVCKIKYFVEGD